MRKRKLITSTALIFSIISLYGCSQTNVENNTTQYEHTDSFVKLEKESTSNEENTENTSESEESTPETQITTEDIFKEPEVDLGDFYSEKSTGSLEETKYTDSKNVDFMIEKLKQENGFNKVEILNQWYDSAIKAQSYYVLFDDSQLYCVSEDSNNEVYANLNDYEYYLEIFGLLPEE